MSKDTPRGIVVLDVGATNTKVLLFDPELNVVAEESAPSARYEGDPYLAIDPAPILTLAARVIPAFDRILPVDVVVPCTHGSAAALLDASGACVLPIMDYNAEPPAAIVEAYAEAAPSFDEVCAPINPGGLTMARQLWWQAQDWPDAFARTHRIVPFAQALGHWLGGRAVSDVTSWGAQTHLWDVREGRPSSVARARGWDALMAELVPAWENVGHLSERYRGQGLRGRGEILAGIHDSSANFLRYAGSGLGRFALLSTGTWIIGFDAGADPSRLDPARDTACGLTIEGKPVPICRFKGGEEYGLLAGAAPPPVLSDVAALIDRGVMALPNFTASGGPLPGPEGEITGAIDAAENCALAALYCAQMTVLALEAMSGEVPDRVVVDGPFSQNAAYMTILASLLSKSAVSGSTLREGTAAGAALLGLVADQTGALPALSISLASAEPAQLGGLRAYHDTWRQAAAARV
ncbi:MAG: hypothetical protein AAGB05_07525 [Pseudomonadota bacterium]